jgi:DNA polymerase-3 subunit delta'
VFENFLGNRHVVRTLEQMIALERIPQTILFAGPEGVGKATLARMLGAALLPNPDRIETDDLSLAERQEEIGVREKWTADKRNDTPLQFASHPDFITFPPDGPLRQITIQQMRALKEQAAFQPHRGKWRIFLIDQIDRANEQAANSLLKILEEPPAHLLLIATAQNAYDLLPTIRSRSVILNFSPLSNQDMHKFAAARGLSDTARRMALSAGSPGLALSLDLVAFEKRRLAMQVLLQVAAGTSPFSAWLPYSEAISRSKNEKLEIYLRLLYELLRDLLLLRCGAGDIRNQDLRKDLTALSAKITPEWIAGMVKHVDELQMMVRRNIQKVIALDALILGAGAVR